MIQTLIVEDEFTSRMILNTLLLPLGPCHVAWNGQEAVDAFAAAARRGAPYGLVCLDIHMPGEMNGHAVLKALRDMERAAGLDRPRRAKVIMTTAARDPESITDAFRAECDAYLMKPIEKVALRATEFACS